MKTTNKKTKVAKMSKDTTTNCLIKKGWRLYELTTSTQTLVIDCEILPDIEEARLWALETLRLIKDKRPEIQNAILWEHGVPYGIYEICRFHRA